VPQVGQDLPSRSRAFHMKHGCGMVASISACWYVLALALQRVLVSSRCLYISLRRPLLVMQDDRHLTIMTTFRTCSSLQYCMC
jgi:hypothetical protein